MRKASEQVHHQFQEFCASLIGVEVSHVWRGYGSALFIELGDLTPRHRRDGTEGNPQGQFGLCIEWSWRIEGKRKIWCGSWSDEERWPRAFARLKGLRVSSVSLFGRFPEINMALSNGLHVVSFMTAEGDPSWTLSDHNTNRSFEIVAGRLVVGSYSQPQT